RVRARLVQPVDDTAAAGRMGVELGIGVELRAQRLRRGARGDDGLREVAGVVALHADRVRKRPEGRAELARAALPLVLVLDATDHADPATRTPRHHSGGRRSPQIVAAPEGSILPWRAWSVVVEES